MNHIMWSNAATRANVGTLSQRGIHIFGPGSGDQACGEVGEGRMLEPLDLAERVTALQTGKQRPSSGPAGVDHRGAYPRAHRPRSFH